MERAVRIDLRFGARLRRAMAERDMTAKALAGTLGVGRGTVTRWRKGECPDDLRWPSLATALGVDEDWLRMGAGDEGPGHTIPLRLPTRPQEPRSAAEPPPGASERDLALLAARLDDLLTQIQAARSAGGLSDRERDLYVRWLRAKADLLEQGNG